MSTVLRLSKELSHPIEARLVKAIETGEPVVIIRDGITLGRLEPKKQETVQEKRELYFGVLKGKLRVPEDFNDPLDVWDDL
ncbi:hypothetical protein BH11ARM2_BH11ARM2_03670 [soil metagenome]